MKRTVCEERVEGAKRRGREVSAKEAYVFFPGAAFRKTRSRIFCSAAYLGQRAALANGHLVADLDITEGRRHVARDVLVTLLETVVLHDVVQVVPTDDASAAGVE